MMMKEGSLLRITLSLLLCLVTIHHPPNFCTAHSHSDSEVRCIESERHALLNFKHDLLDPSNRLASWAAASDVDCCHWVGVLCHNVTGHVLQLHLRTFLPAYDYMHITDDVQLMAQSEAYWRSVFGGDMGSLESIDFSTNQLSGQLPQSMSSLTFLSQLNLSNNHLVGKIPSSTQLQSLNASSFVGNKFWGPPLIDNCIVNDVKQNIENKSSKDFAGLKVDWFYMSMALGFVVEFWVVLGPLLLNKQWRILYFQFLDHLGYKVRGLVAQTW